MQKVVIVSARRSPIGSFGGVFKDISAVELGTHVLKSIIQETGVKPSEIDEVIIGNVIGAGLGQNVARQIAINAGLPVDIPSFVVNKVCGSGMKSISLAALMIESGRANIVVAGGVENMSQIPYILPDLRWGAKMGDRKAVDLMIHDGLTDIFNKYHMGITAENLVEKYSLTREAMDEFAVTSQNRAEKALQEGRFTEEIVPISIPQRRGEPVIVSEDEYPRKGATIDSVAKLKPAFKPDGKVTAANSSGINDGAAILLMMSEEKARELNLTPLAYYIDYASAGVNPSIMGIGPVPAIKKVLTNNIWSLSDIELAELNEAFAGQSLAVLKGLEHENIGSLNQEIVNVNGGAIALGHPIGASGARIVVTLLHEMKKRDVNKGLASLCIGGGMGIATLYERK
ncbi:MAG: acetyl-CoA C-acetyltransferase [Candidatus Cloacimonetes bacterium]|nr:acetyl-CoA C-acetyltransferase [Candidatus Cloacimonadota bacterium]